MELRRPQFEQAPQLQGGGEGIGERLTGHDRDRRHCPTVDLRHQHGAIGHASGVEAGKAPERGLVVLSLRGEWSPRRGRSPSGYRDSLTCPLLKRRWPAET